MDEEKTAAQESPEWLIDYRDIEKEVWPGEPGWETPAAGLDYFSQGDSN